MLIRYTFESGPRKEGRKEDKKKREASQYSTVSRVNIEEIMTSDQTEIKKVRYYNWMK